MIKLHETLKVSQLPRLCEQVLDELRGARCQLQVARGSKYFVHGTQGHRIINPRIFESIKDKLKLTSCRGGSDWYVLKEATNTKTWRENTISSYPNVELNQSPEGWEIGIPFEDESIDIIEETGGAWEDAQRVLGDVIDVSYSYGYGYSIIVEDRPDRDAIDDVVRELVRIVETNA